MRIDEIGCRMSDREPATHDMDELEALRRKAAELEEELRAARAEQDRIRRLVDHMNYGVVVCDIQDDGAQFVVREFNRGAERIESMPARNTVGHSVSELFPHVRSSGLFDKMQAVAGDGQPRHHQTRLYEGRKLTHCHNDYIFKLGDAQLAIVYYDSTQRMQTEEELRRFAISVEQSIDGIALNDLDGHFLFANNAWAQMHGRDVEELIGHHISICYTAEQMEEQVRPCMQSVMKTGGFTGEISHVRKDGSTFPALMSTTRLLSPDGNPMGMIAVARDITQLKSVEQRLRVLEAAVRDASEGIIITSADLSLRGGPRIVFVNEGFTRMTGYTADEVVGQPISIMGGPDTDPGMLDTLARNLARGLPYSGVTKNYRKDGSEFESEWKISPVRDSEGNITHFVAIQSDVTERRRAEEARRESEQIATIAGTAITYNHEINNPLNAITGYAEMLLHDVKDEDTRENIQAILRAAGRIHEVIRHIDSLAHPSFKTYIGDKSMLDLGPGASEDDSEVDPE
ncbi:PAS domain S-box protein [bacterium]|nr:PAS domain S-box protein [bacterium]